MTRLIDADALSEKLCETTIFIKDGEVFQRMINDAPTVADAVQIPIKLEKRYPQSRDEDITDAFMRGYLAGRSSADRPTGHIVTKCSGKFNPTVWAECSECGKPIDAWDKFCRHCGAKMGDDVNEL